MAQVPELMFMARVKYRCWHLSSLGWEERSWAKKPLGQWEGFFVIMEVVAFAQWWQTQGICPFAECFPYQARSEVGVLVNTRERSMQVKTELQCPWGQQTRATRTTFTLVCPRKASLYNPRVLVTWSDMPNSIIQLMFKAFVTLI